MQRLLNFLYQYRNFFIFAILEVFSFYLIIQNNRYQSAVFFNSSNLIAASILNVSHSVREYFGLKEDNAILAEENAQLRRVLEKYKQLRIEALSADTSVDLAIYHYSFITAKVINNSVQWRNNTLTVNKGSRDGVTPGMAVVGSGGVVGKVKYVNRRYAVITSLLHTGFTISSRIKNKVELCTSEWNGEDPEHINIRFVPRHHLIEVGDTILTSGYNAIFPPDIIIGVISELNLDEDATFYDIRARLVNDFSNLSYVHIIKNAFKAEKDSLEHLIVKQEL